MAITAGPVGNLLTHHMGSFPRLCQTISSTCIDSSDWQWHCRACRPCHSRGGAGLPSMLCRPIQRKKGSTWHLIVAMGLQHHFQCFTWVTDGAWGPAHVCGFFSPQPFPGLVCPGNERRAGGSFLVWMQTGAPSKAPEASSSWRFP